MLWSKPLQQFFILTYHLYHSITFPQKVILEVEVYVCPCRCEGMGNMNVHGVSEGVYVWMKVCVCVRVRVCALRYGSHEGICILLRVLMTNKKTGGPPPW